MNIESKAQPERTQKNVLERPLTDNERDALNKAETIIRDGFGIRIFSRTVFKDTYDITGNRLHGVFFRFDKGDQ